MSHKIYTALIAVALGLGVYIGKQAFSVTKTVEVEKAVVRNDIVTVVKEVVKPDGTKEIVSTTTDKSVERKDSTVVKAVAAPQPQWHISASASVQPSSGSYQPVYGLQVERSILGPFSIGVHADTNKQIGLVIGYEF